MISPLEPGEGTGVREYGLNGKVSILPHHEQVGMFPEHLHLLTP